VDVLEVETRGIGGVNGDRVDDDILPARVGRVVGGVDRLRMIS
jgi:hypothetical protein